MSRSDELKNQNAAANPSLPANKSLGEEALLSAVEKSRLGVGDLATYISAELASEAERKRSLEARALAMITANLAVATLFISVQTKLYEQGAPSIPSLFFWVIVSAGIAAVGSVVSAILASAPTEHLRPSASFLSDLRTHAMDADPLLQADLLYIRELQLERTSSRNDRKAAWLLTGYYFLAGFALFMVVAMVLVLVPPWG